MAWLAVKSIAISNGLTGCEKLSQTQRRLKKDKVWSSSPHQDEHRKANKNAEHESKMLQESTSEHWAHDHSSEGHTSTHSLTGTCKTESQFTQTIGINSKLHIQACLTEAWHLVTDSVCPGQPCKSSDKCSSPGEALVVIEMLSSCYRSAIHRHSRVKAKSGIQWLLDQRRYCQC